MTQPPYCHRMEIHLQPMEPQDLPRLKEEITRILGDSVELRNLTFARYGRSCTIAVHTTFPGQPKLGPGIPLPRLKVLVACSDPGELEEVLRRLKGVEVPFFVSDVG